MDRLTEAGDTPQEPNEVLCSGLSFLIHGAVRSAQLGQEVRLAFPAFWLVLTTDQRVATDGGNQVRMTGPPAINFRIEPALSFRPIKF